MSCIGSKTASDEMELAEMEVAYTSISASSIHLIRRCLTTDAAHALVRAIIHSRLDYYTTVFSLDCRLFAHLQSVLRAAARLILWLPGRRAPVSAVISDSLHWLFYTASL